MDVVILNKGSLPGRNIVLSCFLLLSFIIGIFLELGLFGFLERVEPRDPSFGGRGIDGRTGAR
jgi:hypothetical protein